MAAQEAADACALKSPQPETKTEPDPEAGDADPETDEGEVAVARAAAEKANNLSDLTSASTARTNLGVAIGTNVQAFSANLDEYAAVNPTAAGLALLDDADAAAARASLGLGSLATQNGTFSDADTDSNSRSMLLSADSAVRWQEV